MEFISQFVNPFYEISGMQYSISTTEDFELLIKPGFVETNPTGLTVSSSGTSFPVVFCGSEISPKSNYRVVGADNPKLVADKAYGVALPMTLINSFDQIIMSHSCKAVYRLKCTKALPTSTEYVSMSADYFSNYTYTFSDEDDLTFATMICDSEYKTSITKYVTEGKYIKTLRSLIAVW